MTHYIFKVYYVYAHTVFIILCCLKEKINTNLMITSIKKTLYNSKNCSESCINIFVPAVLLSHWLISQVYMSKATFGTIFRITGGFRNSYQSQRRLSVCIIQLFEKKLKLESDFKAASRNFIFTFLFKHQGKALETISDNIGSPEFLKTLKKG
jgi:hypothetical protein